MVMKHFTTEDWVDFARGTVEEEKRVAMLNHLESGCKKCGSEAQLWQRVRTTAARVTTSSQPTEGTLRTSKLMFDHADRTHGKRAIMPKLLFDSFLGPLPAGIRSAQATPRQMLFGEGSLRVDLRLEPMSDSDSVALIGQVLDSGDSAG